MQFFENFSSFPNEIDKKEQIQIFYCLIINSLSSAGRWQQHRRIPRRVERAKNNPVFKEIEWAFWKY